ncbi:hypothetical protein HYW42_03835 [Candidatus Daviesbacteria bacterium]|nr:hypothetical protein [Candidatus Daviesbacteria bacterium]
MPKTDLKSSLLMTKDERKLAVLKAQEAREKVFKLVVKIISWETGSQDSIVVRAANRITSQEWLRYKKHQIGISGTGNIEKVKNRLAQTFQSIKNNGGFE